MQKILITPEIAKKYLEKNISNRPVNKATVQVYTRLMNEGKWGLTPDAIGFDVDGYLMNGQHRMLAVVASGKSFEFFVVEGLPKKSFAYTDEGRKRTGGDIFGLEGIPQYNIASSVVRSYMAITKNVDVNSNALTRISNERLLETYRKHEKVFQDAITLARRCYKKLNFLNTKEIGGIYVHLVLDKQYECAYVGKFFDELFFNNENNPTITLLRDRLIKEKMSKATLKYGVKLSLIAKTWNAYVADRKLRNLKYIEEEGRVRFN